ncbi:MAG: hypothetical protein Q9217_002934 [Psora testacea]
MTTETELQALLRFLSQDAKVSLPTAMGKIKDLQSAKLTSPAVIAKTSLFKIQTIFPDEKHAKAVLAAAKRVIKKRSLEEPETPSPAKRSKSSSIVGSEATSASVKAILALPTSTAGEEDLASITLHTNRAPLVLAFAVVLLKYTMPSQPLSSRLSLAQAAMSLISNGKAVSLGLIRKGTAAAYQGWVVRQPGVKILGREIKIMRRHGYQWKAEDEVKEDGVIVKDGRQAEQVDSQMTLKKDEGRSDAEPALWGLDLEELRSSNGAGLHVSSALMARAYLLKSFASPPADAAPSGSPNKNTSADAQAAEKKENLAKLLRTLDMLYASWAHVLAKDELDRRAWSWYVAVRPHVKEGVAGWGGKGEVKLEQILQMRRKG